MPISVTDDSSLNINPVAILNNNYRMLIVFQTNRNGNWDIAYKEYLNGKFGGIKYIAETDSDETNPSVLVQTNSSIYDSTICNILFERNGSIFWSSVNDSSVVTKNILQGSDSIRYSQPTGIDYRTRFGSNSASNYVSAKRSEPGKIPQIVIKKFWPHEETDSIVVVDNGKGVGNPRFLSLNFSYRLTFEKLYLNRTNIFVVDNWNSQPSIEPLIEKHDWDVSNLKACNILIPTKSPALMKTMSDLSPYLNPHTFQIINNDSTFIRVEKLNAYYNSTADTLIFTNSKSPVPSIGHVGFVGSSSAFYTVWKDTGTAGTSLFGNLTLFPVGGINDNNGEDPNVNIDLKAYPNPFNTSTQISYAFPLPGHVKLRLYDINGCLIRILKDDFLQPGSYRMSFSGKDLASGIYFVNFIITYPVPGNRFTSKTQKLILIK